MRKWLVVAIVIVMVVGALPAQAGLFSKIGEWLFGAPEHLTVLKDGTNSVSQTAFKDSSMRDPRMMFYLRDDPTRTPHVMKGWVVRGLVNWTSGSGKTTQLDVWLDSDTRYFRIVPPPPSGLSQDRWIQDQLHPVLVQDRRGQARYCPPDPFASYRKIDGAVSGPVFFVYDTSNLVAGNTHKLYIRTIVRDGRNKLMPAESCIDFIVDDETTAAGQMYLQAIASGAGFAPTNVSQWQPGPEIANNPAALPKPAPLQQRITRVSPPSQGTIASTPGIIESFVHGMIKMPRDYDWRGGPHKWSPGWRTQWAYFCGVMILRSGEILDWGEMGFRCNGSVFRFENGEEQRTVSLGEYEDRRGTCYHEAPANSRVELRWPLPSGQIQVEYINVGEAGTITYQAFRER